MALSGFFVIGWDQWLVLDNELGAEGMSVISRLERLIAGARIFRHIFFSSVVTGNVRDGDCSINPDSWPTMHMKHEQELLLIWGNEMLGLFVTAASPN